MIRKRKTNAFPAEMRSESAYCSLWKPFSSSAWWWVIGVCLGGILPRSGSGVNVFARDEKKYAILFQSVVLPCHYTSMSTQTAVVQWVYKSYCRDRTRDSFSISDSMNGGLGGRGLTGRNGVVTGSYDARLTTNYIDCADTSRTVRTVASISGSSITLSEYYKDRDITIINKADLRIGKVHWGDSGVYTCKVVISDDLEGPNEASVELLALGFSGVPEDLLPDFHLRIMPEWVFVVVVVFGSVLFLVLVGVCWCQCCPHSCCCYVRCWCCPDTCCCPRHLYEAGKGLKSGTSSPQGPAYPPYFVSGVPTMVPIAPPSLVDSVSAVPPSNGSMIATASTHSELSSLHDGETAFRQTYRNVQKKALPPIPDQDPQPESLHGRDRCSPEPQRHHNRHSSPHRYRHDPDLAPADQQDEPLLPRRYNNDSPPSSRLNRTTKDTRHHSSNEEDGYLRWNPRSEHLQRKSYQATDRRGSLDELEEFTSSYKHRGARGAERREEEREQYEMEHMGSRGYPSYRDGTPQYYNSGDDELDNQCNHTECNRRKKQSRHDISPLASPERRRGSWGRGSKPPPPVITAQPATDFEEKEYDATLLNSLLERKARLRGGAQGKRGSRSEEDSDTPSKESSKKASRDTSLYGNHSAGSRPEASSPRSPCSDMERARGDGPSPCAIRSNTHSSQLSAHSLSSRSEEPREKSRKVSTLLSRDSLIV